MSLETPSIQPQLAGSRKGKWRTFAVVGLGIGIAAYGGVDQYRTSKKAAHDKETIGTLSKDLAQSQAAVARLEDQMAGLESKDKRLQEIADENKAATDEYSERLEGLSTQITEILEMPQLSAKDIKNLLALMEQYKQSQEAKQVQDKEIANLQAALASLDKKITVDEIADICREVKPSVVEIGYFFTTKTEEKGFLGIKKKPEIKTEHKGGGGVVVATLDSGKKGGYIATSWHIINHAEVTDDNLKDLKVQVLLFDGRKITAKPYYITDEKGGSTLAKNEEHDLILLKTEDDISNIKPIAIADKEPETGDMVLVMGSPFGLEQSVSMGIVSATRDAQFKPGESIKISPKPSSEVKTVRIIQTDAAMNPGNSGGAGIRVEDGKLVFISTFIMPERLNHGVGMGTSAHELADEIKPWILNTHTLDTSGRFVEK